MLDDQQKEKAQYLSKFIVSCTVGLFDSALNYLWDETISRLKEKIASYDINYFYDSIISTDKRSNYNDSSQLIEISDWQIIRGCHQIGIISELGFKHLSYIRDMRNYASAAHPNQSEITGLQLIGWFETCINEVIAKRLDTPIIEIKRLLISIRTQPMNQNDAIPIVKNFLLLPKEIIHSILKTMFGMFVDETISVQTRNNIRLLAKSVWDLSNESTKNEIGLKHGIYSANGQISKKNLSREFLVLVNGLSYLNEDVKAVEMKGVLDELYNVHNAWNNFYNEIYPTRNLRKYVPSNGRIPDGIRFDYVKTIILCRVGNKTGIARDAIIIYNELIALFTDEEINDFISLLHDSEVYNSITDPYSNKLLHFKAIAKMIINNTRNQIYYEILNDIINRPITDSLIKTIDQKMKIIK
jgi:hypothetical protein